MAITVSSLTTFQTIEGFGGSCQFSTTYSAKVADFLWRTDVGIGLSIVRSSMWVNTSDGHGWPRYFSPMDSTGVEVQGDFSHELEAYARGVRLFQITCSAPQLSAPFSWLTGGSQNGSLILSHYGDMATAFTTALDNALAAGVYITHVSMMNEPDITPAYPQTAWTTAQALSFAKNNLGPALVSWGAANPSWQSKTGMVSPGFIFGETANWSNNATWINAAEGDLTALGYITHYGTHQYFAGGVSAPPSPCSRNIWQNECFDQAGAGTWDATMTSAMTLMTLVFNALTTGNASAWHYWMNEDVSDTDNSGLVGTNATNWTNPALSLADWNSPVFTKRAYCMGNFSKFVRPGAVRISATGAPAGVNVLAFSLKNGGFAIVCINTNGSSTAITVNLTQLNAPTVSPYVTDANNNLVQQPPISISAGSFSATLTANSVTTFVSNQTPLSRWMPANASMVRR